MTFDEIEPIAIRAGQSKRVYYQLLEELIIFYDMRIVLECGTGGAGSTHAMALASDKVLVVTIDNNLNPKVKENLEKLGNVICVEGNTLDRFTHKKVVGILQTRKVDMLFLDTTHDGITPRTEYEMYSGFLKKEAIVTADDITLNGAMKNFWSWMPGEKRSYPALHPWHNAGFGISIIRR